MSTSEKRPLMISRGWIQAAGIVLIILLRAGAGLHHGKPPAAGELPASAISASSYECSGSQDLPQETSAPMSGSSLLDGR